MPVVVDENVDWIYWVGFFAHIGVGLVPLVRAFMASDKKKKEAESIYSAGALMAIAFMNLTLLIDQGVVERDDTVMSVYARWAYQAAACFLTGMVIAHLFDFVHGSKKILPFLTALPAIAVLFASISTEARIYAWIGMAGIPYILLIIVVACYPVGENKRNLFSTTNDKTPLATHLIKFAFLFHLGLYGIIFVLGHSATRVITLLVESSIYLFLDVGRAALLLVIVFGDFGSKEKKTKSDHGRYGDSESALPLRT